ncbi:hypothetical protein [Bradyrhizobium sp. NP1]|jgi:hypothetical protein|uniref:hypothetical protein n=1 Tax=Bradyrhizobium sp. NP1 TaxID=3049772 RepID=UPI0025A50D47|nr:hypothetical protein [Bradyrhizobium sp. NP1]WJR76505.1 hypothetical protein QOU61_27630 [Bradyrhizobium sp. NP1]
MIDIASFLLPTDPDAFLLRLLSALAVFFLFAWLILRRWTNRSGIGESGFSPAVSAALFAPALLVVYFIILVSFGLEHRVSAYAFVVFFFGLLFAPTFLLLLPVGIASIVMARRKKPISNWKLWLVLATWLLSSWGLLAAFFSQGH